MHLKLKFLSYNGEFMNQYEINEFPSEVVDEIKYYVYRLIDPRNKDTFYVGKGKGNRVFNHMKCAIKKEEVDELSDKISTIRDIRNSGLNVIHVIHRHGMDEKTSIEVEAALIDAYPGATNIQGGHSSNDYGPMNAIEIIHKYAAEEADIRHNILMITINKSILNHEIYDSVRFAWKVNAKKAAQADYILAVKQGVICGIFIAEQWKEANKENFPEFNVNIDGRFGFIGREAEDSIKKLYMRKRIPEIFRQKGAANPIKYNF